MKKNRTIGLIFGGISPEHSVSVESAKTIFRAYISNNKNWTLKILPFYIDEKGIWYDTVFSSDLLLQNTTKGRFKTSEVPFSFDAVDIWLPMIHGKYGEDGIIHRILQKTGIPYMGTDPMYSKRCFDKILSRNTAKSHDIVQPDFIVFENHSCDIKTLPKKIKATIGFPCFVKPSSTGSSIGISKVYDPSEIQDAIIKATKIDRNILIEKSIEDCMELEIAVIGRSSRNFSEIGTISYKDKFYTNAAKYSNTSTTIIIPAPIPFTVQQEVHSLSEKLCDIFKIKDFCRIDFFYEQNDSKLYWNEINTIPGFTQYSMFPLLWKRKYQTINIIIEQIVKNAFK